MIRLLIVDDEKEIADHVASDLRKLDEAYSFSFAGTSTEALTFDRDSFDAVLLDIMLPDTNGIEICPRLRDRYHCPIIFMSCLDDSDTIVHAFENGGDDYVCKPFDSKILHARILANLRRVKQTVYSKEKTEIPGKYMLNADDYTVTFNGETRQLLPIEFRILSFLMEHPRQYYKARELYQIVWGADSFGDNRTVIVHIHNIRKKLEDNMDNPQIIRNERGRGYSFFS